MNFHTAWLHQSGRSVLAFFFLSLIFGGETWANITIDTVPVDNVGNSNDPLTGNVYGGVSYSYRIGTTEVTNTQYAAFLNEAATTDPLSLYSAAMGTQSRGGITRSGSDGSYTYAIKSNMGNKPVVYVNWYDAIRFANWLHNGQGSGDTETGAYTLGALGAGGVPLDGASITRNVGATWFLTSENEWYKAAYHKNDGATSNFFAYPTGNDLAPTGGTPPGGTNSANTNIVVGDLTVVGAYSGSDSPYGTFDQGGNVSEWNESLIPDFGTYRGSRGGSWNGFSSDLRSSTRYIGDPLDEMVGLGFRVATVPLVSGDFNANGIVDAADYIVWRKSDGTPAGYNAWRAHFGEASMSGSGATATVSVPEPATLLLMAFAAAICGLSRVRTA